MILQEMNGNGHWKRLPTATILVPTGDAVAAVEALTVQLLTAVASARPTATTILASALHFM